VFIKVSRRRGRKKELCWKQQGLNLYRIIFSFFLSFFFSFRLRLLLSGFILFKSSLTETLPFTGTPHFNYWIEAALLYFICNLKAKEKNRKRKKLCWRYEDLRF